MADSVEEGVLLDYLDLLVNELDEVEEVAERLDYLGARFSLDINHDSSRLSIHFLSRVFDGALDFFSEISFCCCFDAEEPRSEINAVKIEF